jgi:Domain of unknown function (DUF2431)/Domain of unknown function (DUF4157)
MPAAASLAPKPAAVKPKHSAPVPKPAGPKPAKPKAESQPSAAKPAAPALPAFVRASIAPTSQARSATSESTIPKTGIQTTIQPATQKSTHTQPLAPPTAARLVSTPPMIGAAGHTASVAERKFEQPVTAHPLAHPVHPAHAMHSLHTAPPAPKSSTAAPGCALPSHTAKTAESHSSHVLPPEVKNAIENSYSINLDGVEFHADSHAQAAAASFSARAFAYGKHIFLGRNEKLKDLQLIAHETAHVVQQQSVPTIMRSAPSQSDPFEIEADRAAAAVMRGEKFSITGRVDKPRVQRWSPLKWVREHVSDAAYNIPGYRLLTVLIGRNPITGEDVDRSAANILRGMVELVPVVGHQIEQALDKYGVFDKIGNWLEKKIQEMFAVGRAIKQDWDNFVDDLGWTDIRHPIKVVEDALGVFERAIERIGKFIAGVVIDILEMLRKAILVPLAQLIKDKTSAWDLLTAVLGKDPITGEKVDGSPEAVIGGFMKLIHEDEVWENIKKANAISRAWNWFKTALKELLGFVSQIPSLFIDALKSLEIEDIILLPKAVIKVIKVFGSFALKFISWAGEKVWSLLQIIFEVVAPGAMPYLKKVGAAIRSIFKHPIQFVGNLVKAGKLGFQMFADNFGQHLKESFLEWLTGSLKGVYIPKSLDLKEIVQFVLSVLGLTWENIRGKLVKVLGETAVKAMETGFDIVVTLVKEGPAAAWDKIVEQLSNLKDMVIQGIMSFIIETVVKKAVAKVLSMLVPGGAFIQAIISIYDTIMVFIDKLAKIIQVAKAFLDSLIEIVSGKIEGAAKKVENTLAGLLTLAISFLAGFLGLGKIADKVLAIVEKIRAPIDKALDKVIDWIVTMAKKAGKFIASAGVPQDPNERLKLGRQAAVAAVNTFAGRPVAGSLLLPLLAGIKVRYGFIRLDVVPQNGRWHVVGEINPRFDEATESLTPESVVPEAGGKALLVGEGNFTFALSIAVKTKLGERLVATDYVVDERKTLQKTTDEKKRDAVVAANISKLNEMGVEIDRQVDARNPVSYPTGSFDTIVFNHPLVLTRVEGKTVRGGESANVQLIRSFLTAAKQKIKEGGKIIVISSLFRLQRWKLDQIADTLGLESKVLKFLASEFPEYIHEKTETSEAAPTVTRSEQFAVVFTVKPNTSS